MSTKEKWETYLFYTLVLKKASVSHPPTSITGSKAKGPTHQGLKHLKPWARITIPSLEVRFLGEFVTRAQTDKHNYTNNSLSHMRNLKYGLEGIEWKIWDYNLLVLVKLSDFYLCMYHICLFVARVSEHRRDIYMAHSLLEGHLLTFLGVCVLNNNNKICFTIYVTDVWKPWKQAVSRLL